jgi:hypothetical protein
MNETPSSGQTSGSAEDWGKDFEEACKKEWEKKAKKGVPDQTWKVDQILVKGSNPISGYRIILKEHP